MGNSSFTGAVMVFDGHGWLDDGHGVSTLMIGDTTHDLQLALNAGAHSVAVSYGAHEPEAFGDFPTRFVAHSTPELHAWLAQHA